ncbi:MAG: hypothetical protein FJ403_16910 [Verrucomicrobia bacterium]|nr:hypothetical protein [Verrucomicrobiota bacterium]
MSCFASKRLHVTPALFLFALGAATASADWPEFRGPSGIGYASAPGRAKPVGFPLHWSETNNVKWQTAIPYRGYSTPVVMGGQDSFQRKGVSQR